MTDSFADPEKLQLSPEAMRALGYRVVDMLVDHYTGIADRPVGRQAERAEMEALLREPAPEEGADPLALLTSLERDVFGNVMQLIHPRFFAYISGPANFTSVMAETLAAGFNPFMGTWIASAGATQLELVTVDWLRVVMGLPDTAGGLFVSGGSAANLTALHTARHARLGGDMNGAVAYCSDQTHASIDKAFKVLGFAREQLVRLPSGDDCRMDMAALRARVAADRAAGKRPFCVIANAGTTNTGAIDPLPELAEFCRAESLWLHADGAYGASAMLCDKGRALLRGLESVDSLSVDPHKWMFQPYEIGCVLVRDRRLLRQAFEIRADYMQNVSDDEERPNFCDHGIQLTRNFRALKLWFSIKTFGMKSFRAAVTHGMAMAEHAESLLRAMPDWEVCTAAQLALLSYRFAPAGLSAGRLDEINRALVDASQRDGFVFVSSTNHKGRTVLRLNTINPNTTPDDIRDSLNRLDTLARTIATQ